MSAQITYRMARPDDSNDLARYMCIAGGGLYEFLFDDLIPFVTAVDVPSRPASAANATPFHTAIAALQLSATAARSSPQRMFFLPIC